MGCIKFVNFVPVFAVAFMVWFVLFLLGAPGSNIHPASKPYYRNAGLFVVCATGMFMAGIGYKVAQNEPVRPKKTQLKPIADPYEKRLVTVEKHLEDLMDICKDANKYN